MQGRTDIELNQNGIDAAIALGRQLAGVRFDKIFSSPLKRAVHTAQLIRQGVCEGQGIAPESLEIQTDPRLIEMSFGVGEGCLCDEWFADGSPYRFFFTQPQKFPKPPQDESFDDVSARAKKAAEKFLAYNDTPYACVKLAQ